MTDLERRVLDKVRQHVGAARLESAIVYLDQSLRRVGERVAVGDVLIALPWDGYVAFVDLEPSANWGHACLYLAVRDGDDDVVAQAAQMPPFLKCGTSAFRLLHRGSLAPEWAVATDPD
jgi:hypothetical protein